MEVRESTVPVHEWRVGDSSTVYVDRPKWSEINLKHVELQTLARVNICGEDVSSGWGVGCMGRNLNFHNMLVTQLVCQSNTGSLRFHLIRPT
jgi:hypothetical protein